MSNTENVKFVIDAEDRATAKIRKVTEQIEGQVKQVQQVGSKAKASAELVGSLANSLGNSGVGAFAGEIAGLTEKVSAFGEVAKQSGAAALLFKAALAGGVAIGAFKAGEAIGNLVFQTAKWNDQLGKTLSTAEQLQNKILARQDREIQNAIELVRLNEDLGAAAADSQRDQVNNQLNERQRRTEQLLQLERQRLKNAKAWNILGTDLARGNRQAAEQQIAALKQQLEQIQSQRNSLNDVNSEHTDRVASLQRQVETMRFVEELEKQAANQGKTNLDLARERAKQITDMRAQARALVSIAKLQAAEDEKAAKAAREKAQAIAQQKEKQRFDAAKRVADTQKRILDNIRQQVIELNRGKEAARVFALQQQGLGKSAATAAAGMEAALERYRKNAELAKQTTVELRALNGTDQRLLSGRIAPDQAQIDRRRERQNRDEAAEEFKRFRTQLETEHNKTRRVLEKIADNIGIEVTEVTI